MPPTLRSPTVGYILVLIPFILSFFTRFAPGSLAGPLAAELDFSGAQLGLATGTYFYVYTVMQLPAGAIIDRIGIRWAVGIGTTLSAGGLFLYSVALNLPTAVAASALIGFGSSTSFLGVLRAIGVWYPASRFAAMSGTTMLIGNIGSIAAGGPLASLLSVTTWRGVLAGTAVVSLLSAVAVLVFVRHLPSAVVDRTAGQNLGIGVGAVLRDRTLIAFALVAVGTNSTFYTFTSLWGTPFLTTTGIAGATAATVISVALLVYGLTSLAVGRFSDVHGRKPATMVVVSAVGVVGWVVVLIAAQVTGAAAVATVGMLLVAIAAGSVVVVFSMVNDHAGARGGAVALAVVNGVVFLVVAVLQQVVGWLVDIEDGGPQSYAIGIALVAAVATIGFGFALRIAVVARRVNASVGVMARA
jgi:MFS family permease